MLLNASGGSEGSKVLVKCRATSRDMYVVTTKKAVVRKKIG
jgi:hypothetical protein